MCHVQKIEFSCRHTKFKPLSQCRGAYSRRSRKAGQHMPMCKAGGNSMERPLKIKLQKKCPTCRKWKFLNQEQKYVEHSQRLRDRASDDAALVYYGERVEKSKERIEQARELVKRNTAIYAPRRWVPKFAKGVLPVKKKVGKSKLRYGYTAEHLATNLKRESELKEAKSEAQKTAPSAKS